MSFSAWYGQKVYEEISQQVSKNLDAAAIYLTSKVKENVNVSQPYKIYGKYRKGLDPSKPGEKWRKITGFGGKSLAWERESPHIRRVGSNVKYVKYLEFGTSKMAARPALNETLQQEAAALHKILHKGL